MARGDAVWLDALPERDRPTAEMVLRLIGEARLLRIARASRRLPGRRRENISEAVAHALALIGAGARRTHAYNRAAAEYAARGGAPMVQPASLAKRIEREVVRELGRGSRRKPPMASHRPSLVPARLAAAFRNLAAPSEVERWLSFADAFDLLDRPLDELRARFNLVRRLLHERPRRDETALVESQDAGRAV